MVTPPPYFGGTSEGSECHWIGRKLTLVCSLLEKHASPQWTVPYRRACGDWQALLPTLNRSVVISAHDADEFKWRAASFVEGLRASFDWVTVTPKMHVLACHSAAFLRRFGSLGRYSEQAFEALHGRCNQEAALHTAGNFLGSRGEFVKASAMSQAPGGDLYINGRTRKPARAGARAATRADDCRLRGNKTQRGAPNKSAACKQKDAKDVAMWSAAIAAATARRIGAWETRRGRDTVLDAIEDGLIPPDDVELLMGCLVWAFPVGDEE